MRIRSIKPETWTSEALAALPVAARLTFIGLWTYADDEGRGKADARLIRAAIWPLDDDVQPQDVQEHMDALAEAGLILRYCVAGVQYFAIPSWRRHQHPVRPKASKLPAPIHEHAVIDQCRGSERAMQEWEEEWDRDKTESAEKPRARNELVDTLAEIEGSDPLQLTRPHARALGVAVAAIRQATPDVSPDELRRRALAYRQKHPTWELTGPALAKHWASLENGADPDRRRRWAEADRIIEEERRGAAQ